jgi:hypothetical protein
VYDPLVPKGEPIPPLSPEDYESCVIMAAELDRTLDGVRTPGLRRQLGDIQARIRAAIEGYEAVGRPHENNRLMSSA